MKKKQVLVTLDGSSILDKKILSEYEKFKNLVKLLGITQKQALAMALEKINEELESSLKQAG